MTALERIVVVGGSLAGLRAAQALRRQGFQGSLTIIGEERRLPYNRPPLSKDLLAGAITAEQTALPLADLDATWRLGRRATALDLRRRVVRLDSDEAAPFDGLVIATGAAPRRLEGAGDMRGVSVLRTVEDCLSLRRAAMTTSGTVVVIGAGFIGSEAASTLRAAGCEVTVIDPLPLPLAALGPTLGSICVDLFNENGIDLRLGRGVIGFEGGDRLERVLLDDGSAIETEVALVAIGVSPCVDWLAGSGLVLDRGVVCDATSAALGGEHIVAAGDVARWPHPLAGGELIRVEHWSNAVEQGTAAAAALLAGAGCSAAYAPVPSFWSDQFGIKIQSLGLPQVGDRTELVTGSLEDRRFVMLFGNGEQVVGAVAFSHPRGIASTRTLVASQANFDASVEALRAA